MRMHGEFSINACFYFWGRMAGSSACAQALSDLTAAPSTPSAAELALLDGPPSRSAALLILSHIDHAQLVSVGALQSLRHALRRDCGSLALWHANDGPEVRLQLATNGSRRDSAVGLSVLPSACGWPTAAVPAKPGGLTAHDAARLLDARCHAPAEAPTDGGGGGVRRPFAQPLAGCLAELAGGEPTSVRRVLEALGASRAESDATVVSSHARLLLSNGLEAARCFTFLSCTCHGCKQKRLVNWSCLSAICVLRMCSFFVFEVVWVAVAVACRFLASGVHGPH